MKRAIVLAGGGSRGAYELGVWQALSELGERFTGFYGTSIGAINAALMAQDELSLSEELWSNITLDQVMTDGINLEFSLDSILSQRKEILPFLKQYARNRGADITPLIALARRVIDESRIRARGVSLGLVTVKFPSLAPVIIRLNQMPSGMLVDYLMASSACFPAFPVYNIGAEGYIDGGYFDNLPISMAINDGAEEIVAVDLHVKPIHPHEALKPHVTYIHPAVSLGSILSFDQEVMRRNRLLGYYDALKTYGRLTGSLYSFKPVDEQALLSAARRFSLLVSRVEAGLYGATRSSGGSVSDQPMSDILSQYAEGRPLSFTAMLLRGCEVCAELLGLDIATIYDETALFETMKQRIVQATDPQAPSHLAFREDIGAAAMISDYVRVVLERRTYTRAELKKMCAHPNELIAALYLVARSGA